MNTKPLMVSIPDAALAREVGTPPGVLCVEWDLKGPPPAPRIDMVVLPYGGDNANLYRLRETKIRLIQSQSIGYDGIEHLMPRDILYANASSVHEASTGELALALILASERHIDDFVRDAMAGVWHPRPSTGLAGQRVVVLGAGGVGAAVIERLRPFDVELSIVASRERRSELGHIQGMNALDSLLAKADILVVCLPLATQTRDLIDDRRLSLLPTGSLVVNVGRGPTINGAALTRHAESGRIRVASDVFDPEPLPPGHPFYSLRNVIVAPHVGGGTGGMRIRMAALVRKQLERLNRGEPPLNVVLSTWPPDATSK